MWRRQGHEPDPDSFVVRDPEARGARELWLQIYVRGWDEEFSTQLATFDEVTSSAEKSIRRLSPSAYLRSSRITRVALNRYGPLFAVTSIGGYPVPTRTRRDQLSATPNLWRETLDVAISRGEQRFVDVFEMFPQEQIPAFAPAWEAIALESPFPEAPDLHWSAVVVPKPLDPVALEFRRAFVAAGDPPPCEITLTGREAGAP
jgi:hypothetical protein